MGLSATVPLSSTKVMGSVRVIDQEIERRLYGQIKTRKDNARMKKANADIREAIMAAGLKQWQIADSLKISENTLCRRLRHELTPEGKKQILDAIQELKGVPAP